MKIGDLVCGKTTEEGLERFGVTNSRSVCKVLEGAKVQDVEYLRVVVIFHHDDIRYCGEKFWVPQKEMRKIYNKTE